MFWGRPPVSPVQDQTHPLHDACISTPPTSSFIRSNSLARIPSRGPCFKHEIDFIHSSNSASSLGFPSLSSRVRPSGRLGSSRCGIRTARQPLGCLFNASTVVGDTVADTPEEKKKIEPLNASGCRVTRREMYLISICDMRRFSV